MNLAALTSLSSMPDTYGYAVDAERARETVRAIFDGPVKFLDSSRLYGFGRSENRASLRDFFEVNAKHIVLATLHALAREKQIEIKQVQQAVKDLGINPEKANPAIS